MNSLESPPQPKRAWVTRAFAIVEDIVYIGLGLLLAGSSLVLSGFIPRACAHSPTVSSGRAHRGHPPRIGFNRRVRGSPKPIRVSFQALDRGTGGAGAADYYPRQLAISLAKSRRESRRRAHNMNAVERRDRIQWVRTLAT